MSKWWERSKPNEIKPIPWLAPEAISYLEKLIQPDWEIIEHGSGGSTLWFAERARCVTAFEKNAAWLKIVKEKAPQNVILKDHFDGTNILADAYDLCLIDGEPVEDRKWWLHFVDGMVRPDGHIVLDNANRPEYAREREGLKQFADLIHTVNSNAKTGHHFLVTEFWKMKGGEE